MKSQTTLNISLSVLTRNSNKHLKVFNTKGVVCLGSLNVIYRLLFKELQRNHSSTALMVCVTLLTAHLCLKHHHVYCLLMTL